MRLRREQIEALGKQQEAAFVVRMVRHLRDDLPAHCAAQGLKRDEDLEELVRLGVAQAEKYGVLYEPEVERYVECMVLLGPRFDRDNAHRWAGDILRHEDIDGTEKMEQISGHLLFQLGTAPTDEPLDEEPSR